MAHNAVNWIERTQYPVIKDDGIVTGWTNVNLEQYVAGGSAAIVRAAENTSGTGYIKSNTFDVPIGSKYRICLNAVVHAGAVQAPKIIDDTSGAPIHALAANVTTGHHEYIFETTHTVKATCRVVMVAADTSANWGFDDFTMEDLTNRNPLEKEYKNSITCYPLLSGLTSSGGTLSTLCITDPLPDSFQGSYEYTMILNANKAATRRPTGNISMPANMYVQPVHTPQFPETLSERDIKNKIEAWVGTWPTGIGTTNMGNPDQWHMASVISNAHPENVGFNFCNSLTKDGGFVPYQSMTGTLLVDMKTSASIAKKRILIQFGRANTTSIIGNQSFELTIVKNVSSRHH